MAEETKMFVKILKDSQGRVFTPKVSADSVYLSGSTKTLTTKFGEIQSALDSKLTTPEGGTTGQVLKKTADGYAWGDETDSTYTGSNGITVENKVIKHTNAITAGTVSEGGVDRTLAHSGSFKVPSVTYDAQGHITGTSATTLTLPSGAIVKGDHYDPVAEDGSALSADANSTTAATWGTTSLVTGVNLARDSKGHVTGVTVDSIKMPANPNTTYTIASGDANGQIKVTPSVGDAYNVDVTGLGSAAYTESSDYAAADHNHDTVYAKKADVESALGKKVDKETGKSLVADTLIAKLSGGAVAADNAGFVTGGQVHTALESLPQKDTTYTFAEGTTNGAFTVKPSDGTAQTVTIHGLGDAAYKAAGVANGVATLGADGKVPSTQLPSYVDDVIEAANKSALPAAGEAGKIYVTLDDNKTYRWGGSTYVEISASLAIGTTTGTAYDGALGAALATTVNNHVGNNDIHVTTSDKTAWNAKYAKPAGGIPKTDLASAVQTSLGKADTAVQPAAIAKMESTDNKVTSWSDADGSSEVTDTHYPSEKLVKRTLDGKSDKGHTHAYSEITGTPTVDSTPASGSSNLISSGAVFTALAGKADKVHTHNEATETTAGFMPAADKKKLNGIQAGATAVEAVAADNISAKIKINGTEKTLYTHPSAFIGTPGSFTKVTVDAYGHVTGGSNPTTLAGYGITSIDASVIKTGTIDANRLPESVTKMIQFEDAGEVPAFV